MSDIRKVTCPNPTCAQGPNGTTPEHLQVFECVSTVVYDHLGYALRIERQAHGWVCGVCAWLASSAPAYRRMSVCVCTREGDEGLGPVVTGKAPTTWSCPQCNHQHETAALLEQDILNGNLELETGTVWACCAKCSAELTVKVVVNVEVVSVEVTVFTPEEDV